MVVSTLAAKILVVKALEIKGFSPCELTITGISGWQDSSTGTKGSEIVNYVLLVFAEDSPDATWVRDDEEKAKYAKFKNRDVHEIYHRYTQLFGQVFDSDKYAMMPTKLSQRGFDEFINSGSDSPHDTLPIFAETRDSSDEGPVEL
ncbi:Uncharacterized protein Fot_42405 [Forsythia ovata]|uniref:Uncharacterized protein n=1 Tax=Forsythia ovata TaxID=205694 RepID=A0ABD1RMV1_9LAMI